MVENLGKREGIRGKNKEKTKTKKTKKKIVENVGLNADKSTLVSWIRKTFFFKPVNFAVATEAMDLLQSSCDNIQCLAKSLTEKQQDDA